MTSETSDKSKQLLFVKTTIALILCSSLLPMSQAQYDGYQQHYGRGGGSYDDYGMDERPRLNLGIRLRIPAFKFELPRFSLPKITVSAKIRQPDKPRVINLPEINLDTTSKVEPPGGKHADGNSYKGGGSSYGGSGGGGGEYKMSSSNYNQPSMTYDRQPQQEMSQTFTFSTGEETHPSAGNSINYHPSESYQQIYNQRNRPLQSPMRYANHVKAHQQRGGYHDASMMSRLSHTTYSQLPGSGNAMRTVQSGSSILSYQEGQAASKNPDLGFNKPVYVNPESANP